MAHGLARARPAQEAQAAAPAWLAGNGARARLALELLGKAPAHGLDPAHYGAGELGRRFAEMREDVRDPAAAAAFERALDAAITRYLGDLHDGRTASVYRAADGAQQRFDAAAYLAAAVAEDRLAQAVEAAAPAIPLYGRVQAGLANYRALVRRQPQWQTLPPVAAAGVRAGDSYAGAGPLRERLRLLGDLDDAGQPPADPQRYTPELAAGLGRFQARHGLAEDGVLGPRSLAALSVTPAQRVDQLAATLERLRWLPAFPPGRIVAVNLPAYRLWAFDSRDRAAAPLEMRIIVGTAARTPTPLFIGQMRYLELNPYWNVPRSIAVGEILPSLARDPSYLARNDMELVSAGGQRLPRATAEALAAVRTGRARIRQRPGPRNVLGALKFAMPNPMGIYLHSTSARELFGRHRRDLSHGCIRVEHPVELAQFVLADRGQWDRATIEAAIASTGTRTVTLPSPVPVVLFYATAVVDRNGRALFAEDIYGLDPSLIAALRAP